MKYLKPYKIFESQSDLELTINDILIDIIDDDYYVRTSTYNGVLFVDVGLFKGKTMHSPVTGQVKEVGELFTWDEVKESMKRLFSYFDSIGLKYYLSMIDSGWNSHPFKIENDDFICIKDNGKECQKCIYQRPHVDLDKNIGSLRISINVGKLNESFESEENLDDFQSEYDALVSKVNQARRELDEYEKSLNDKKLYVNKGKVKKVVDTWGIFWDVDIYDHWDGHAGEWVIDSCQGAEEMKEEPSDAIRELIACWDILANKDRISKLDDALRFYSSDSPDRFAEGLVEGLSENDEVVKKSDTVWEWGNLLFEIEETSLKIKAAGSSRHDEGDPKRGSYIMFRLTSDKEIKSTKNKSKYGIG